MTWSANGFGGKSVDLPARPHIARVAVFSVALRMEVPSLDSTASSFVSKLAAGSLHRRPSVLLDTVPGPVHGAAPRLHN